MKMILAYAFIQILGLAVLHDVPGEGVHVMFPNVAGAPLSWVPPNTDTGGTPCVTMS